MDVIERRPFALDRERRRLREALVRTLDLQSAPFEQEVRRRP